MQSFTLPTAENLIQILELSLDKNTSVIFRESMGAFNTLFI